MKLLSSLKNVDFMARSPSLNLAGKSGANSYFGSLISLGVITAMALIVYKAFADYFDTTGPAIVQITSFVKVFPRTNLIEHKIFPVVYGFYLNETQMTTAQLETHITPAVQKYIYKVEKNSEGVDDVILDRIELKRGIPCKDAGEEALAMLDSLYESDQMKTQVRRSGYCFPYDKEYMSVVGGFGYSAEYLYLTLSPCVLGAQCVDQNTLESSYFAVTFSEATFDPSNKENPVKYTAANTELIWIQPNSLQVISNRLKRTQVVDSGGIISSDLLRSDTFSITNQVFKVAGRPAGATVLKCNPSEIEGTGFPTCPHYVSMEFQGTGSLVKNKRTYRGLLELSSDVGGLYEIIALIGLLIYLPFAWYIRKKTLLAKIFPFITLAKKENTLFKKKLVENTEAPGRSLMCCRKKKDEEVLLEQMEDAGMEVVEKSLDVVEIVKSLDRLKVITSILFHSYHFKLIPIMAMDLHVKQALDKKEIKRNKEISAGHVSPMKRGTTSVRALTSADMVLDYEEAIEILKGDQDPMTRQHRASMFPSGKYLSKQGGQGIQDDQPAGNVIKRLLDEYCIAHLKNSHLIHFEEPKPSHMIEMQEPIHPEPFQSDPFQEEPEQPKSKANAEPILKESFWDLPASPKKVQPTVPTFTGAKKPGPTMIRKKIG